MTEAVRLLHGVLRGLARKMQALTAWLVPSMKDEPPIDPLEALRRRYPDAPEPWLRHIAARLGSRPLPPDQGRGPDDPGPQAQPSLFPGVQLVAPALVTYSPGQPEVPILAGRRAPGPQAKPAHSPRPRTGPVFVVPTTRPAAALPVWFATPSRHPPPALRFAPAPDPREPGSATFPLAEDGPAPPPAYPEPKPTPFPPGTVWPPTPAQFPQALGWPASSPEVVQIPLQTHQNAPLLSAPSSLPLFGPNHPSAPPELGPPPSPLRPLPREWPRVTTDRAEPQTLSTALPVPPRWPDLPDRDDGPLAADPEGMMPVRWATPHPDQEARTWNG